MKTRMLSMVLVFLLALAVGQGQAAMGTAFTYQGRLIDANYPADGLYDFEFKLFDDPCTETQQGNTIYLDEVDVIDGYFTAGLDFGNDVFDGDARWLQIGIRPGDMNDPNIYTVLEPRQEVTPTPYALYAKNAQTAGSDSDWMVSGNDMYSIPSGNVGIGTDSPDAKLQIQGRADGEFTGLKIRNTQGSGSINTSSSIELHHFSGDSPSKIVSQQVGTAGYAANLRFYTPDSSGTSNEHMAITSEGNVGIGTDNPTAQLQVNGSLKADTLQLTSGLSGNSRYGLKYGSEGNVGDSDDLMLTNREASGALLFGTSGQSGGAGGERERIRITYDGNVGIGTTSPGAPLEVVSSTTNVAMKCGRGDQDGQLSIAQDSQNNWGLGAGSFGILVTGDSQPIGIRAASSGDAQLVLRTSGNVGIGTTSPSYKLDVSGDIRATGTIYGTVDNADKVDGYHASSFVMANSDYGRSGVSSTLYEGTTALSAKYLGISATATNSDKLDGYHAGNDELCVPICNGVLSKNLNADFFDGCDESVFFRLSQSETVTGKPSFNGGTSGSTPPFYVDSTYIVTNLNADMLDGAHGTKYLYDMSGSNQGFECGRTQFLGGYAVIPFSTSFSSRPVVVATAEGPGVIATIATAGTTDFHVSLRLHDGTQPTGQEYINWIAIGPR